MRDASRNRIEDYLTVIEQICEASEGVRAKTGIIARMLCVSDGACSIMLKRLSVEGLVDYLPYEGAAPTEKGRQCARRVLRRRRLIKLLLCQTLCIELEFVNAEAWHLEPAISDSLIETIDNHLGNPLFDPHGDPIPRPN